MTITSIKKIIVALVLSAQVAVFANDAMLNEQPKTIVELHEMLAQAVQEDVALMMGNLENSRIAAWVSTMDKRVSRNHSNVADIKLATAKRVKKRGKQTVVVTWASIPGLTQEQIKQLNHLQYRYAQEFYRAIHPKKKTYEVTTMKKDVFGRKTGMYYPALTLKQKRQVQQMHIQRAMGCVQAMMKILNKGVQAMGMQTSAPTK